jgi:hypothetical protein
VTPEPLTEEPETAPAEPEEHVAEGVLAALEAEELDPVVEEEVWPEVPEAASKSEEPVMEAEDMGPLRNGMDIMAYWTAAQKVPKTNNRRICPHCKTAHGAKSALFECCVDKD